MRGDDGDCLGGVSLRGAESHHPLMLAARVTLTRRAPASSPEVQMVVRHPVGTRAQDA